MNSSHARARPNAHVRCRSCALPTSAHHQQGAQPAAGGHNPNPTAALLQQISNGFESWRVGDCASCISTGTRGAVCACAAASVASCCELLGAVPSWRRRACCANVAATCVPHAPAALALLCVFFGEGCSEPAAGLFARSLLQASLTCHVLQACSVQCPFVGTYRARSSSIQPGTSVPGALLVCVACACGRDLQLGVIRLVSARRLLAVQSRRACVVWLCLALRAGVRRHTAVACLC